MRQEGIPAQALATRISPPSDRCACRGKCTPALLSASTYLQQLMLVHLEVGCLHAYLGVHAQCEARTVLLPQTQHEAIAGMECRPKDRRFQEKGLRKYKIPDPRIPKVPEPNPSVWASACLQDPTSRLLQRMFK